MILKAQMQIVETRQ